MSRLIPISLDDRKTRQSYAGLTESDFYDQVEADLYPAIYVDLSASSIASLSFDDGILKIDSSTINLFSGNILDIVKQIRGAGGQAWITSEKIALCPALFVQNFQSLDYIRVEIDKSPINIGDFHTRAINNIVDTIPTYTVLDVVNDTNDKVDYSFTSTNNLYVDELGTAVVQYSVKKFILLINRNRLLSTKYLIKYAKDNTINSFEKSILLNQFLNTFNMLYEHD